MLQSHKIACDSRLNRLASNGLDLANWYDIAQEEIAIVCQQAEWDIKTFTNVLAIMSPQVAVRRNIRMAIVYFGQERVFLANTLPNVKRSLEVYLDTGKIGGHKVPYFASALLGDHSSVTLDTHMAKAMLRLPEPHIKYFRRQATFDSATKAVSRVGRQLGLSPRDCQAAIWSGQFRDSGREPAYFPILSEYDNWLSMGRQFPLEGVVPEPLPKTFETDSIEFDTRVLETADTF